MSSLARSGSRLDPVPFVSPGTESVLVTVGAHMFTSPGPRYWQLYSHGPAAPVPPMCTACHVSGFTTGSTGLGFGFPSGEWREVGTSAIQPLVSPELLSELFVPCSKRMGLTAAFYAYR